MDFNLATQPKWMVWMVYIFYVGNFVQEFLQEIDKLSICYLTIYLKRGK